MSWSSGKDSTLALALARKEGIDVRALLTTFNGQADRVAMHAVRRELVEAQASRLSLPLVSVDIPSPCSNELYEQMMARVMDRARGEGVTCVVFGDLYLADVRAYRTQQLQKVAIEPVFPLWGKRTDVLAKHMLDAGIKAVLTCVDLRHLPGEFVGRDFDENLVTGLPKDVDPCGENGEFHTFVYDGPGFSSPIEVTTGELVERDGFVFCDVCFSQGNDKSDRAKGKQRRDAS